MCKGYNKEEIGKGTCFHQPGTELDCTRWQRSQLVYFSMNGNISLAVMDMVYAWNSF